MVVRARNRAGDEWQAWVLGGKVVTARDVATVQNKAGKKVGTRT